MPDYLFNSFYRAVLQGVKLWTGEFGRRDSYDNYIYGEHIGENWQGLRAVAIAVVIQESLFTFRGYGP